MSETKAHLGAEFSLSRDEVALLDLIANGRTRKEIAEIRGVSVGTIQRMTRVIEAKVGARTTEQAIAKVARAGIL